MSVIRSLMVSLGFRAVNLGAITRATKNINGLRDAALGVASAVGAMALAFKQTVDIERSVGKAMSIVDKSGSEFHSMKNQMMKDAMDMSETLGFAASEIGEGFYQVISAGIDPTSSKFKSLADLGFKMAKLGNMAPADAIEKLNDTLNAFALNGDQYARVADVVFKASNLSAVTIPQLVESMRDAGPAAYQAGLSIEETSAIIATMAERGIKGSEAGTAFRMVMNRIASGPGKEALKKIGISAFDANGNMLPLVDTLRKIQAAQAKMTSEQKQANMVAIAGRYAYSKLGGLLSKNMDVVEDWTAKLEKSGGSMNRAFVQYSSLAGESLTKLKHSLINLIATLGTPFLKPTANTADYFRELSFNARKAIESGSGLGKTIQVLTKILVGGGGFLVALLAVNLVAGLLIKSLKILKGAFLSSVGNGAMLAIIPLLMLIEVIDTLRGKTTWLGEALKSTVGNAWREYSERTGTPIIKKPGEDFRSDYLGRIKKSSAITEGIMWANPTTWPAAMAQRLVSHLNVNQRMIDAQYFPDRNKQLDEMNRWKEGSGPRTEQKSEYNIIFPNVVGPIKDAAKKAGREIIKIIGDQDFTAKQHILGR